MEHRKTENFIMLIATLACFGMCTEIIMLGWEFWVPPVMILGTIGLWICNLIQKPEFGIRRTCYLVYSILMLFYYGVHLTGLFDVAVVIMLVMAVFSLLDKAYMMHVFLAEYVLILFIQYILTLTGDGFTGDLLSYAKIILHMICVFFMYLYCLRAISDRVRNKDLENEKDAQIEAYDADMEDFLSNISHELRTPVNVVSGMSDLMIKRNAGKEAYSIKNAGIRLAYQIEDIQDYTECKRDKLLLEEEDYMSTSLINDVVTSFRLIDNSNKLELVVDLAPSVPNRLKGDIKKLHKIFRHLLENAVKFTPKGGILVRMYSEKKEYGVNLCIEMTDTGIGMDAKALEMAAEGMYQANKKRNRSAGGIGLGLYIVYGFAHSMGGFVKIISEKKNGTMVRVTIPQKVADPTPCLKLSDKINGNLLFHVKPDKYKVPKVRDFYRTMAANLAGGIGAALYSAESVRDIERLREKMQVSYIFMGQEEYEEDPAYFDELSKGDIVVAVSANTGFAPSAGSKVMIMPKPLYAYPVIKILNEGKDAQNLEPSEDFVKPMFTGVRALIVDDEPMNLVVASSIFSEYEMIIDTAGSGMEALEKFRRQEYDVVFMDHMMPEMDGVEAMKRIRKTAEDLYRKVSIIVLTANVVSGAKEMFIKEGFDGFISKPIITADFERVMVQVLRGSNPDQGGKRA